MQVREVGGVQLQDVGAVQDQGYEGVGQGRYSRDVVVVQVQFFQGGYSQESVGFDGYVVGEVYGVEVGWRVVLFEVEFLQVGQLGKVGVVEVVDAVGE